jgi:hypothetical protein
VQTSEQIVRALLAQLPERHAQETQERTSRQQSVERAWGEVQDRLRQALAISDLTIAAWVPSDRERLPLTGDLVRLRLPALTAVAPEAEVTISLVVTVAKTGQVLYAAARHFYYQAPGRGFHRATSLDEAIFLSLEEFEPCPIVTEPMPSRS